MNHSFVILKGNLIFSKDQKHIRIIDHGYLVSQNGQIQGVYRVLPEEFHNLSVQDYGDCLIIPGLIDLHMHAPQYAFRGLGMDMELLDWLEANTFPEEAKFNDLEYAKKSYEIFTGNLKRSATTRACVFATVHKEATLLLMDMLEESGMAAMVGKVNMDRNAPDYLVEESAAHSAQETLSWIQEVECRGYKNTKPILTPRFTPSCTDDLMARLQEIQKEYRLPVQSHLSENPSEAQWVKELCPWSGTYADAYDRFGLFGSGTPTVMAHCVYSNDTEIKKLKTHGVYVAHCPESNTNLSSGIAPVKRFLDEGIHIGIGSDIAAGSTENLFRAMTQAIQVSKLRWRLQDPSRQPLTIEEVFYMATKGGGEFFGNVGSFEPGYELDAVVLDDKRLECPYKLDSRKRLERLLYLSDERDIKAKYVKGRQIL